MLPMENKIELNEKSFDRLVQKPKDLGTVYHRSLWRDIVTEIKSNPVAILAVVYLFLIITACLLAVGILCVAVWWVARYGGLF